MPMQNDGSRVFSDLFDNVKTLLNFPDDADIIEQLFQRITDKQTLKEAATFFRVGYSPKYTKNFKDQMGSIMPKENNAWIKAWTTKEEEYLAWRATRDSEVDLLKKTLSERDAALEEYQNELERAKQEIEHLNKRIDTLHKNISDSESTDEENEVISSSLEQEKRQNAVLTRTVESQREAIHAQEQEMEGLQATFAVQTTRIRELEETLHELSERNKEELSIQEKYATETTETIEELRHQVKTQIQQMASLTETHQQEMQALQKMVNKQVSKLEQQYEAAKAAANDQLREVQQDSQDNLAAKDEEIATLERTLDSTKHTLDTREDELEQARVSLGSSATQLSALETELAASRLTAAQSQQELSRQRELNDTLSANYAVTQRNSETTAEALRVLQLAHTELEQRAASLVEENANLANQVSFQTMLANTREIELTEKGAESSKAQADLLEATARVSSLTEELAEQQQVASRAQHAAEDLASRQETVITELRGELQRVSAEKDQASEELRSLRTQHSSLQGDLTKAKDAQVGLKDEVRRLESQIAALETASRAKGSELSALQEATTTHIRERDESREQLASVDEQMRRLQAQLEEADLSHRQHVEELETGNTKLVARIAELEAEKAYPDDFEEDEDEAKLPGDGLEQVGKEDEEIIPEEIVIEDEEDEETIPEEIVIEDEEDEEDEETIPEEIVIEDDDEEEEDEYEDDFEDDAEEVIGAPLTPPSSPTDTRRTSASPAPTAETREALSTRPTYFWNIFLKSGGAMEQYFTDEFVEKGKDSTFNIDEVDVHSLSIAVVGGTEPTYKLKQLQQDDTIHSTAAFAKEGFPNEKVTGKLIQDHTGRVIDATTDKLSPAQQSIMALKQAEMILNNFTPKGNGDDAIIIEGGATKAPQAQKLVAALLLLKDQPDSKLKDVKIICKVPGCTVPEPTKGRLSFITGQETQEAVNQKFIAKHLPADSVREELKHHVQTQVTRFAEVKSGRQTRINRLKEAIQEVRSHGETLSEEQQTTLAEHQRHLEEEELHPEDTLDLQDHKTSGRP